MPPIETKTREAIAAFLPHAILRALTSYEEFTRSSSNEQECKDYAARHTASKAAIAHIELLMKLAKWADLPDPKLENAQKQAELSRLIQSGQEELGRR